MNRGPACLPRMFLFVVLAAFLLALVTPLSLAAGSLNWSQKVDASDASSAPSLEPVMLLDEHSCKYFIWMDSRDDNWELYFSVFDSNDVRRTKDIRITHADDYSAYPAAVMDSRGDIHVVWMDNRDGGHDVFYAKLDRNGTKMIPDKSLTRGVPGGMPPGRGGAPAITIDALDRIHIVFSDDLDGSLPDSPLESDLFYCSVDVRGNILIPSTRITFTPGESIHPDIAASAGGELHVTWQDNRDGKQLFWTVQ